MSTTETIPYPEVNLVFDNQSIKVTHTTAGTPIERGGTVAFTAGATIEVVGIDTWVAVGSTEALADANAVMYPAGVPFRVMLIPSATTLWIDAATGGTYCMHQVGRP